ncbi:MAG: hypothetical protein ACYCZW_02415 [Minisyncoccota bacterium]
MQIQKTLPQFENKKALLVVCGRQISDFYTAHKGTIRLHEHFKFITPTYSDKEGFAVRAGKGEVYGSGWVREKNKHDLIDHFMKEFNKILSKIIKIEKINYLYFFIPHHYQNEILEKIPKTTHKKIIKTFSGNYSKKEPFHLLGIIKKDEIKDIKEKKVDVIKKEAKLILKKSNQARKVIKGRPDKIRR